MAYGVPFEEVFAEFSEERQERIKARAAELEAEYLTLQDLRKAHDLTQTTVAQALHVSQESVSQLEQRSDMLLSTLRGYVEAMGGELRLTAEFPGRNPVLLAGFGDLIETPNEPASAD